MNGDFSRNTFDERHRFSRVLMQQGRVLLDADWNEQTSILLHYLRTLAADLIGPHGGPGTGFQIGCTGEDGVPLSCDFTIAWGHYYVDGILIENHPPVHCPPGERPAPLRFTGQPDYPLRRNEKLEHGTDYLVYLDVWERHVTQIEADHIREVALGGPDTATRAKVVWQVKAVRESECHHDGHDADLSCWELLQAWVREAPRCLRARARVPGPSEDPCVIPPSAHYRGAENQLYRVEIHSPSQRKRGRVSRSGATFKWSRDNGSVEFAIRGIQGDIVTLDSLGRDAYRGLEEGDWVEVMDDSHILRGRPGALARVEAVDRVRLQVALAVPEEEDLPKFRGDQRPRLRRWDQGSGAIPVREGKWVDLEDGVQVWFEPDGAYRTGDYWLVPARTATGDVLWPTEEEDGVVSPRALPPHGIEHHYAPLARVSVDTDGAVSCDDCRCTFHPPCAVVIQEIAAEPLDDDPCSIRFTARARGPEPLRYHWDFGNGLQASDGETATHRYSSSGAYTVRLTVTSDIGQAIRETRVAVVDCGAPRPNDTLVRESERVAELVRINSVGEARARMLLSAERDSPESVAAMSVEEIRSVLNITESLAETIRESARRIASERS